MLNINMYVSTVSWVGKVRGLGYVDLTLNLVVLVCIVSWQLDLGLGWVGWGWIMCTFPILWYNTNWLRDKLVYHATPIVCNLSAVASLNSPNGEKFKYCSYLDFGVKWTLNIRMRNKYVIIRPHLEYKMYLAAYIWQEVAIILVTNAWAIKCKTIT